MAFGAAFPSAEIVFDTRNGDQFLAYWMDVRTRITRTLPLQSAPRHYIQWSPDGSQFAYLAADEDPGVVYAADIHGQTTRLVNIPEDAGRITDFSWSPDGTQVVVSTQTSQWMQALEEGDVPPVLWSPTSENYKSVAWSPDGTRLALVDNYFLDIYIYDYTTGEMRSLVRGDDPDWSPDGSQIVYVSNVTVMVINAGGGTPTPVGRGIAPSWSPDGEWIAFSQGVASLVDLMLYNVETGESKTLLSNGEANIMADWRPHP
jgi:TolB protein